MKRKKNKIKFKIKETEKQIKFNLSSLNNSEGLFKEGYFVTKKMGTDEITGFHVSKVVLEDLFDLEKVQVFKEKHSVTTIHIEKMVI